MADRLMTLLVALAVIFGTSPTYAQEPATVQTAAPEPAAEPDESLIDRLEDRAEAFNDKTQMVERLNGEVDGWYPRLGGMTRGGGFAIGPGYRTHVAGDRLFVDLSAGASVKGYKSADVNVRWLQAFDDRVELWTDFRYEDFPQEDFFGLGLESSEADRTNYDFDSAEFLVRGVVSPIAWARVGAGVGYMRPDIGPGTDKQFPSIEQLFTDAGAPGLLDQPNFLHTTLFGEIDYRDVRGNPRSGGFHRVSFGLWDDVTLEEFDFKRFDMVLTQYVPLGAARRHVLTGRLGAAYVNNETGERVPFYFLAYVGGVDTIRSFREFRFKDENALWMTAEYRWIPITWVSLAGFVDAGEVTPNWGDVDFRGMKTGYGFGVRVHSEKQTFARLDFGTGGGEGWQIFLKLGPSF
jgi:outer membrane protein assembly factor BamA